MTTVLLILMALVILLFSYLLFMPISISLDIYRYEQTSAVSAIGMFPFKLTVLPRKKKPPKAEKKKPRPAKPKPKPAKAGGKFQFEIARVSAEDLDTLFDVLGVSLRFLGRLLKTPERGSVRVYLLGGAPQPDLTGQLYGAVQAIAPVLPQSVSILYYPDFVAGKFTGNFSLRMAVRIFTIVKETMIFVFELPILRIIRLYRKYRKGGRDAK